MLLYADCMLRRLLRSAVWREKSWVVESCEARLPWKRRTRLQSYQPYILCINKNFSSLLEFSVMSDKNTKNSTDPRVTGTSRWAINKRRQCLSDQSLEFLLPTCTKIIRSDVSRQSTQSFAVDENNTSSQVSWTFVYYLLNIYIIISNSMLGVKRVKLRMMSQLFARNKIIVSQQAS